MEGEWAEVVEAQDVVGVGVGVEDGVDVANFFAEGLGAEVGAGVDEDGAVRIGGGWRGGSDGRAGLLGSVTEVQTGQSQPSVGTPMEVPLPRKVRVACIVSALFLSGVIGSVKGLTRFTPDDTDQNR